MILNTTQPTRQIKFITTFSANGYEVYGKSWIESFLEFTKDYPHITAKVYVDGMDLTKIKPNNKVKMVDYDVEIPQHKKWVKEFNLLSTHQKWAQDLAVKFSFKSFVMIDALKNNNKNIVIWLDADSIFTSYDFDEFPCDILNGKFLAIQVEDGSVHCESGIVIFDTGHPDKDKFAKYFEFQYFDRSQYNKYTQFFDGFVLHKSIIDTKIDFIDLNKGYGVKGIQSDPTRTFLNPALKSRFYHNIGITGKRSYKKWEDYVKIDPVFQLIHGANDKTPEEQFAESMERINNKLLKLRR